MPSIKTKRTEVAEGVTLNCISDSKYKTNYLNIYFSLPLTKENTTKVSLLTKVLKRGCKVYPTMAELNAVLDMNYSSTITLSGLKEGEKSVFLLSLSTLKNEYAPNGEDIFKEALDTAFEVIFSPLVSENLFNAEYFESEKKNLRNSILSQINNKASWARSRFISVMCEKEPYAVNAEGDVDVLEKVTNEDLYEFWQLLKSKARCDIYFVGSESEERVKTLVSKQFEKIQRNPLTLPKTSVITKSEKKEKSETLDISQAHLFVGFRTPATYSHPDYLKFVLFNLVLGGDVSSKMFMNIRERLSLCYTCYSSFDATKGILFLYAGIDPDNKDKTLNAFFEELDKIKKGEISDSELDDAKKSFINRMKEIEDTPSLFPAWLHLRLGADERDPELDRERIKSLTKEDIVETAKRLELDTVYFLSAKE